MRFMLSRRRLAIFFAGVALLCTHPVRAQDHSTNARADAAVPVPSLEAQIAILERALEQKNAEIAALKAALPKPAALAAAPAATTADYEFESRDDKFLFLNLGVDRSYLKLERDRLLDNLRTQIPPLYEPAFSPIHGYTLPRRAMRVTITNDRFVNNADFGRDKQYALFFDNVKVENQHTELDLMYGLTDNTTLRLNVPLRQTDISGDGAAFRITPMRMTMHGHAFGVGDMTAFAKHKWWDQGQHAIDLATVVAVQLPTGKNDARFDDAQTIVMNGMPMPVSAAAGGPRVDLFSDDLRVPNASQPGTGAWGVTVGVMGTRQLTWNDRRGALHGGVIYKAFKDTSEGVRPGNELTYSASFVRPPFESEKVTLDLTVVGRTKQSETFPGRVMHPEADANGMPIMDASGNLQMFVTPRPEFAQGTVVFFSPSIVFLPKAPIRISVSPMIRVYQPLQGPSPAFRLIIGLANTF